MAEMEMWKPVVGWEALYEVSNKGQVRSLDRVVRGKFEYSTSKVKGRILTPKVNKYGYHTIGLVPLNAKKQKWRMVHQLVASAFIPNPENKPHVNHIDHNKTNNNVENLEWCTPYENMQHAAKHGRTYKYYEHEGVEKKNAKLDEDKVRSIRKMYYEEKMGQIDIAKMLDVNKNAVSGVITWRTWFYVDPHMKEYYKSIKPTKHKNKTI